MLSILQSTISSTTFVCGIIQQIAAGTDLAGVIGTWVAVSLALIALFGIVTPILLIRRARSERNVALNLINDDDHSFVRTGIKLPGLLRIARSIKAPNLEGPPSMLDGQTLRRDDRALERKHSSTSWIMFVRTLDAYSINVPLGGTLKIHRSRSWLPVHRLWILTVSLLGRYGHRADRGRAKSAPTAARMDERDVESPDRKALSSITGTLRYEASAISSDTEQGIGQVYFIPRDKDARGSLQPDSVSFSVLFWLAMGCLPLPNGRIFDVSRDRGIPHWYATSGEGPPPRAYRFQPIKDPMPGARIISWARLLLCKLPELWWKREYAPTTSEERADVEELLSKSDDPEDISSPWFKSKSLSLGTFLPAEPLLWRSDIQCLAFGILKLAWSPCGSLFDTKRGIFCRRILCTASSSLYALLKAALEISETSTASDTCRPDLTRAISILLPMCRFKVTSGFSRDLHGALFNLEQALTKNSSRENTSLAIEIVFITSRIFRKFVLAAVAEEGGNSGSSKVLTVDPSSKHIVVTAGENYSGLKFRLNFEEVFDGTKRPAFASFTLEEVLLAALRACVRSAAFQFSFDSRFLLDFIGRLDDLVFVSAHIEMPRSRVVRQLNWGPWRTQSLSVSDISSDSPRDVIPELFSMGNSDSGDRVVEHEDDGISGSGSGSGSGSDNLDAYHNSKDRSNPDQNESPNRGLPGEPMKTIKMEIMGLDLEREVLIKKRDFRKEKNMIRKGIGERKEPLAERILDPKFDHNGVPNDSQPDEVLLTVEQERNNLGANLKMLEGKELSLGRELRLLRRQLEELTFLEERKNQLEEETLLEIRKSQLEKHAFRQNLLRKEFMI